MSQTGTYIAKSSVERLLLLQCNSALCVKAFNGNTHQTNICEILDEEDIMIMIMIGCIQ